VLAMVVCIFYSTLGRKVFMSLIQISHLTFSYDGSYDTVFHDVSFQIDSKWKLGLIGRNGRGKTTLLRLLHGDLPARGSIHASVDFQYFPFPVAHPEHTVQDVLMQICPTAQQWEFDREFNWLNMSPTVMEQPFCTLSNGEQTRALLCALFLRDNAFLLIDEPTNHLDMEARRAVSHYLQHKEGFILVSHDRAFLDDCIDHVLAINRADIEVQRGNFSSWQQNRERQDHYELSQNQRLQQQIEHLQQAADQTRQWSDRVEKSKKSAGDSGYVGHKSAKLMKRAKSAQKQQERAITQRQALLHNLEQTEPLQIHPLTYRTDPLLFLQDVSIQYGQREILRDLSFSIRRGDRIALCGSNGCGKSSILNLILGQNISHCGTVIKARDLIISHCPQDTSFLAGDLHQYARAQGIDESLLKTILRKLDFSREQLDKDMRDFSAGQRKKVVLAASLCTKAHLYIWDEPLNYIDVLSRIQIEELLVHSAPTMLFVEHDRAFVEAVCTQRILLSEERPTS